MNRIFLLYAVCLVILRLGAGTLSAGEKPNFILCMADDQGWGDVGYNGHPVLQTPVMDEMARTALRFDRFYAAAPVCSPTRGSVLTGRHPNRFGCFSWGHTLRPQEITLAEALREAGYTTGHFGKWHLGSVRRGSPVNPGNSGFDEWASSPNFYENSPLFSHNGRVIETKGESSRVTVDLALKFITRAAQKKQPFLAVIWFGNPHSPHIALPELQKLYVDQPKNLQNYYGEITGIDQAMGHLRKKLRELGLTQNTLLWYTSDNGARRPGSTGGLRGQKGSLWEGGIRVPALIEWPAKIKAPRRISLPCSTVDIYPTLLDIAGVQWEHQPVLDGESLRPLLEGRSLQRRKGLGFWVYPARGRPRRSRQMLMELRREQQAGQESKDPDKLDADAGQIRKKYPLENPPGHAAWIAGDFKLHRLPVRKGVRYELYNLKSDPKETTDLAGQQSRRLQEMKQALADWQRSVLRSLNGEDYNSGK